MSEDDDDDDDDASSQRKDLPDNNKVNPSSNSNLDAVAYLLRYETMVRQQEAEDMAVIAHLRPCFTELLALVEETKGNDNNSKTNFSLDSEISFHTLQKAVLALEHTTEKQKMMMTTDRQLMMVLKMLTHKGTIATTDGDHDATDDEETKTTITWAEIVQCYKICISGMITLQHLPTDSPWRARARDRTLAILSLFETPSTQLFTNELKFSESTAAEHSNDSNSKNNDNIKQKDSAASSWMNSQRGINTQPDSQKDVDSTIKASRHRQKKRRLFKRKTQQRLIVSFLFLGLVFIAAWLMGRIPSLSFVSSNRIPTEWEKTSSSTTTMEPLSLAPEVKASLPPMEQPVSPDLIRISTMTVEDVVSTCIPVVESHHRTRKNGIVAFVSDHIRQSLWMLV